MNSNYEEIAAQHIAAERFEFVNKDTKITDVKLKTKPVGYFRDALSRFVKNKASVVCFSIIVILILYALLVPFFSPYKFNTRDAYYAYATPRVMAFKNLGFWDGGKNLEVNKQTYDYYKNIPNAILKDYGTVEHNVANRTVTYYKIRIDTYEKVGFQKMLLSKSEYEAARAWEKETGIQLFYPVIDTTQAKNIIYQADMNAWYKTDAKGVLEYDASGNPIDIYIRDESSPDGYAYTISRMNGNQYETRVLYKEWYYYKNGRYANFVFGAEINGYDICTRLAYGARLSLLLSVLVSAISLFIGVVIGALEGYYGGTFDLIMERIKDILYDVPEMLIMALFQLYFAAKAGPIFSMFFAFIFYRWIGTSSTVRAQFYRFKGQDYVNASRTLGAKDGRLIFKHILPNSLGFIITVSVLAIPGVIYSEATLTYLNIVNLDGDNMTSVGAMLEAAKSGLTSSPHALFFPAAFIAILLICFNSFGNGLRDAFNPSLRGAENA